MWKTRADIIVTVTNIRSSLKIKKEQVYITIHCTAHLMSLDMDGCALFCTDLEISIQGRKVDKGYHK